MLWASGRRRCSSLSAVDDGPVGQLYPQRVSVAQHEYAGAVLLVMVVAAPENQIVKTRRASRKRHQVVGFTPCSGNLTPGPAAAAITHQQRPILVVARKAHHRAKIQNP